MALAPLREAADSLAKASTHEPVGKPGGPGLWKHKGLQLPAYIQHIANDLKAKFAGNVSRAIATAIAIVKHPPKNWGPEARAAAAKAAAEWERLKASHGGVSEAESYSIADELALRDAALRRLALFERDYGGIAGMLGMLAAGPALQEAQASFAPTLKRAPSASSETERHEVHDGNQHVGFVSKRRGMGREPATFHAHAINGDRITDYPGEPTQSGAVDALRKHLEEAPARIKRMGTKHMVARPSGYGPTSWAEYSSAEAARHAAGLPPKPTTPEQTSKVEHIAEMLRFDLMTVSGEDIPPLRRVQEARRRDPFELAEAFAADELRDFHGRWRAGGTHLARLTPRSSAAQANRPRSRLRSDAQRRYEGGVARMSGGTRKALLDAFTPAERAAEKQRQPTSNLDELYKHGEAHHKQFEGILRTVAGKLGADVHLTGASAMGNALEGEGAQKPHVLLNSLKGRPRATAKVNGKYNGDASRLNDVVRGSVAVPHVDNLAGAIKTVRESLPKGWTITAPENRFVAGRRGDTVNTGDLNGYRDIAAILRSPQGFNVELQITTTHMQRAKGEGHALYERRRKIVENGVKRELMPAQAHEVRRIDQQAKAMYDRAYLQSNRHVTPRAR